MRWLSADNLLALIVSIILHGVVIISLVVHHDFHFASKPDDNAHSISHKNATKTPKHPSSSKGQSINSVAVDQSQVEQQITQIKQRRAKKRQQQKRWKQHLMNQAHKAQQQKQRAQKQLHQLQQQQKQVKQKTAKQQQKAKQHLAHLKKLQHQVQQKLQQLHQQQNQLKERTQSIQGKLEKTRQALKQEKTKAQKAALKRKLAQEKAQQEAIRRQKRKNALSRYKTLILNAISKQWIIPQGVSHDLSAQLMINLTKQGEVTHVKVIQSSGNTALDHSAITAVYKASPLPVPDKPKLMDQFKQFKLTVKPEGLLKQS